MQTQLAINGPAASSRSTRLSTRLRTIAVVNATPGVLAFVESALEAGNYNLLLLDSRAQAYIDVKRLRPHLIVVCTQFEDPDSCQLLTMLDIDAETRDIPVVTLMIEESAAEREGISPATVTSLTEMDSQSRFRFN